MKLIFEKLDKLKHNRQDFNCGVVVLNDYIQTRANKEMKQSLNSTFVAVSLDATNLDLKPIVGYYTLSMSALAFDAVPEHLKRHVPPSYPIPTARIGRLARDKRYPGIGSQILRDALFRVLEQTKHIGIYGIQVDAKDEAAKKFYQKYGFIELLDATEQLFLPIKTILRL
ncbi:MAG: hypothetical protein WCK42_01090 [Myxococcaceae bacterium]